MSKYRIVLKENGWYYPQRKGIFFFSDMEEDMLGTVSFDNIEEALSFIEEDKKREKRSRIVWES